MSICQCVYSILQYYSFVIISGEGYLVHFFCVYLMLMTSNNIHGSVLTYSTKQAYLVIIKANAFLDNSLLYSFAPLFLIAFKHFV